LRQPQSEELVVLTNPVPFFPFNVPHIKQLPFDKKTEFEGQIQAGVFNVGVQIKVLSLQIHFLPGILTIAPYVAPFTIPLQETHCPVVLSIYEFSSGHKQVKVSVLKTKLLKHSQEKLLALLTSPLEFFPFNFEHKKHVSISVITKELSGQRHAVLLLVGFHV
jgi:hypothetical protein